jgi:ABC-type Fe3+ transport system substrate-binding protein
MKLEKEARLMKVYWNNICLISRFEKQYIENKLEEKHLSALFDFKYFGIGREREIIGCIQEDLQKDSLPDIIVSTESEVFHTQEGLLDKQQLLTAYEPWRFRNHLPHVCPKEKFTPLLYIPLVMIVNKEKVNQIPLSIQEVLANPEYEGQITFGGLDNAAGKTLLAAVEYLYGEEKREQLLKWSVTANMPIGAFKNVVDGRSKIGFVPTIFAMRAEAVGVEQVWPKEGAIVVPCFVAVKRGADMKKVACLFKEVITPAFIQQIGTQTGAIPCIEGTDTIEAFKAHETQIIYPSWEFIRKRQSKGIGEIND